VRLAAYDFTSQGPFRLRLHVAMRVGLEKPSRTVLRVLDAEAWERFAAVLGGADVGKTDAASPADPEAWSAIAGPLREEGVALAFVAPRGVGPTAWDADPKAGNHIRRRFYLLGQTLEGMQAYDVRRAIQAVRSLPALADSELWLEGRGAMGAIALYAALFEPGLAGLDLRDLPRSHRDGPALLGVLRVLDIPQAVALAAARSPVVLRRPAGGSDAWQYPAATARALGWPAGRLRIESE
jgi:hypothetical protein